MLRHPHDLFPHYGELQIDPHEWPLLATTDFLRIAIEPAGHAFPYWAMVSVTDNDTQHVTIFAPE